MTSQEITLNAVANGSQTSTANMIELDDVEKVYRTDRIETVALTNVNLSVRAGEFISIMGPSGSGKSTLLNVIGLLDVPTDQRSERSGQRRNPAALPQEPLRLRAAQAGAARARQSRAARARPSLPVAAFGRSAAARRHRARHRRQSAHPAGRRADRQPGQPDGRGNYGSAQRPERERKHNRRDSHA